jgi:hypothetical protein
LSLCAQCENACDCHATRMADAESPCGDSQRRGRLSRAAGEPNVRRGARRAVDYHVGKSYPRPEASAERLKHRFLCGEPSRQALDPIDPIADLVKLDLDKATRDQGIARILDPAPHLGDVHQVDAVSDDVHKACLYLEPSN